jgi:hypothetical protein
VTAGASLHWMPWRQTLERLASVLTGNAFLAIVDHGYHDLPWRAELNKLIARHSRSPGYDRDFSLAGALSAAGLFEVAGRAETTPRPFGQRTGDYGLCPMRLISSSFGNSATGTALAATN